MSERISKTIEPIIGSSEWIAEQTRQMIEANFGNDHQEPTGFAAIEAALARIRRIRVIDTIDQDINR